MAVSPLGLIRWFPSLRQAPQKTVTDALMSEEFQDDCDIFFVSPITRGALGLRQHLAKLIATEGKYARFRHYPIIHEALEEPS